MFRSYDRERMKIFWENRENGGTKNTTVEMTI